jgi:hypothetical protein
MFRRIRVDQRATARATARLTPACALPVACREDLFKSPHTSRAKSAFRNLVLESVLIHEEGCPLVDARAVAAVRGPDTEGRSATGPGQGSAHRHLVRAAHGPPLRDAPGQEPALSETCAG